eukprot:403344127
MESQNLQDQSSAVVEQSEIKKQLEQVLLTTNQMALNELRAVRSPVNLVIVVFQAIGVLLGWEATEWKDLQAKLGSESFMSSLLNLDLESVTQEQITQIKSLLEGEEITPESASKISFAAASMTEFLTLIIKHKDI